jgi:hypothetical protein
MGVQIVMDQTGDSRHTFDPFDSESLARAERRFAELTELGFTAAERIENGETKLVRTFNPTAEHTLFFPRLTGG